MWRILYDSVAGTSHLAVGQECQDCSFATRLLLPEEEIFLAVCADGAGSATHARSGARLVCREMTKMVHEHLAAGAVVGDLVKEDALRWCMELRNSIQDEADSVGALVRDYACTLLVAVIGESASVFFQVGDGAIVIPEEGGYSPIFWPDDREYVNVTNFVTDDSTDVSIEFHAIASTVDEVALLTDGLQQIALVCAAKAAHEPFFRPLFEALRVTPDFEDLQVPLRAFLTSDAVNARTDDDKTLIIAVRANDTSRCL